MYKSQKSNNIFSRSHTQRNIQKGPHVIEHIYPSTDIKFLYIQH